MATLACAPRSKGSRGHLSGDRPRSGEREKGPLAVWELVIFRGLLSTAVAALALSLAPGAAAALPPAPAVAAEVHDCHVWAYYPNILISSARNLRCRDAAREMRRYDGPIKRRFRTPRGFHCYRVSGGALGGQWRCVREHRAFRFEFGD